MTAAHTQLRTARLLLQAPPPCDAMALPGPLALAVAAYLRRNRAHFERWDPPLPADHAEPARVQAALAQGADAFTTGLSLRWWLQPGLGGDTQAGAPGRDGVPVIGSVHLSGIVRGAFHSANLGYALDAAWQGRGLMHEALDAALAEAFSPRLNLHRVQAAVRPENQRSLAVLRRGGFDMIGLARQYLFIDGRWRDHLLFERRNPHFIPPADWPLR